MLLEQFATFPPTVDGLFVKPFSDQVLGVRVIRKK